MVDTQSSRPSEPITVMITDHIKSEKITTFEAWLTGINTARQGFSGFLSVDETCTPILIHYRHWMMSPVGP